MRHADPRIEDTQIVQHFGDGADRRARILADGLLLDGDGGTQSADEVYARLLHLSEELARVGREAFDIAALPLGVDGIKGQRRLAAATDAGDDDETVARNRHVNMLEVMLLCPTNADIIRLHSTPYPTDEHVHDASCTWLRAMESAYLTIPVISCQEENAHPKGTDTMSRRRIGEYSCLAPGQPTVRDEPHHRDASVDEVGEYRSQECHQHARHVDDQREF